MQTLKAWWARLQTTSAWRAWKRYGDARGNLLAGGVGYFAFFSIFPALLLAFTIFGFVLRDQPQLLAETRDAVEEIRPASSSAEQPRRHHQHRGAAQVDPDHRQCRLRRRPRPCGHGWLDALRNGIRAVFGVPGDPGNVVVKKPRTSASSPCSA